MDIMEGKIFKTILTSLTRSVYDFDCFRFFKIRIIKRELFQ